MHHFGIFNDNLIMRLKARSQIQVDFDRRAKEVEACFADKPNVMHKQLDMWWKQIDKYEAGVKGCVDASLAGGASSAPRRARQSGELTAQLVGTRTPEQPDLAEVCSLSTCATNAEWRFNNTQNQLLATEEKVTAMNRKSAAADAKWEVCVRKYEVHLEAAEECIKRERQGSKECGGAREQPQIRVAPQPRLHFLNLLFRSLQW
ncbi:hypothetical protein FB451DRAFT_1408376 [Mycena latifolia]|nr:hypothetical protein FB451DRAFT_1408376 [Mycena latifolia]